MFGWVDGWVGGGVGAGVCCLDVGLWVGWVRVGGGVYAGVAVWGWGRGLLLGRLCCGCAGWRWGEEFARVSGSGVGAGVCCLVGWVVGGMGGGGGGVCQGVGGFFRCAAQAVFCRAIPALGTYLGLNAPRFFATAYDL